MNMHAHHAGKAQHGEYVVRGPRATDVLGHALRGVFGSTQLPDDLLALLQRLDRVTH